MDGETKSIVERVRLECHNPTNPGEVYNLTVEKCIDVQPLCYDDDGDTTCDEDPIDHQDNDGDTKVDEDPPEGSVPGIRDSCDDLEKPVVIDQP